MKTRLSLLVLIPVVTATTAAWAAPAVVDGEAPSTVVAQPAPQAAPAADDPNIDRALLEPTAMTQPAGSLTYNGAAVAMPYVINGANACNIDVALPANRRKVK